MDTPASSGDNFVPFRNPKRFFSDLDVATTARLITSGVDIALVLDDGVIKDLALGNRELLKEGYESAWRGRPWKETVTVESRRKIDDLLKAAPADRGRWRQVNHPSANGLDIPVNYTTVKTGDSKRVLALGRELRSVALLQQRLVKTHQELEREYARLRHAETRYRHLFDAMAEPVLIVDAADGDIREANPAALHLLETAESSVVGEPLSDLFVKESRKAVERLMDRALSTGQSDAKKARLKTKGECAVRASAFRQENAAYLIVRFQTAETTAPTAAAPSLSSIIQHLPDGLVVTTASLRVLSVNAAFLKMVHIVDDRQAAGEPLSSWLGRSSTELNMLMSNLKSYGVVRNFATVIRDRFGVEDEVEVSAVAAPLEAETAYGFAIRNTTRRLQSGAELGRELPNTVDQVTNLVGRLPLKEIVRESTDLIEKLCIEAALEIAGDNRASAAEILGLSRQGLYSKLKRFGFDET